MTYASIQAAQNRIAGVAHRTPIMRSRTLDALLGAKHYLKCENFQRMGAFKFRGAYNAMSRYLERCAADGIAPRGVITHSSGNHAQAIALSGQLLGLRTTIVMPDNAPAVKLAATRGYGAMVVTYDPAQQSREVLSADIAERDGLYLIPPFDHDDVIAGQGTVANELIADLQSEGTQLDALVVCLGGGGLLSGCLVAAKAMSPNIDVYGVEPEAGDDGVQSLRSGTLVSFQNPDTIADGARTAMCERTFGIIKTHVRDILTVSDASLISAMKFAYQRMKLVVEPTGVLALAACLERRLPKQYQHVGIVISGGNVDLQMLAEYFA